MQFQGSKPIALRSYLYHWKAIETYMSKMSSHDPFGHLKHKLWLKERPRVKVAIWLLTTKSQELTRFPCVHVACDMPLESSQRKLQIFFILHLDRRSEYKIIAPQSHGSSNLGNFGTPIWESRDKKPFGCRPCEKVQNILYGGRWWLPPSSGCGESCEFEFTHGSP